MELARAAAAGHGRVIALGGDGTVREVAMGLAGCATPLALLPCGTGNDLARALRLPTDPEQALDVALHGAGARHGRRHGQRRDVFQRRRFGFDVDVLDETEYFKTRTKNGSLAYLRGLLAAVRKLRLRRTHITWEGGELDRDVLLIAAGNGTHFGGGMNVTPQADPFDGLLDICVIHDVSKLTLVTVLPRFLKGASPGDALCDVFPRAGGDRRVRPGVAHRGGRRGAAGHAGHVPRAAKARARRRAGIGSRRPGRRQAAGGAAQTGVAAGARPARVTKRTQIVCFTPGRNSGKV